MSTNRIKKQENFHSEVILLDNMPRIISNRPPKDWDLMTVRENTVYETGDLIIDCHGKVVFKEGRPIDLTPTEFTVLLALVENVTCYCSRQQIREAISHRNQRSVAYNTISKHIHRTRTKLQTNAGEPYITTRTSRGYKWNFPVRRRYLSRFRDELSESGI